MDLQPTRQFEYLQRTLSIFLSNPSDMSEQFELLIDELIKENKQTNKSPKVTINLFEKTSFLKTSFQHSPESSSSDLQTASNSPQPLPVRSSFSIFIITFQVFVF